MELTKDLTTIVSNISLAIAAIVGVISLWQWRGELVGKAKFEVARKITLLTLQFRDDYKNATFGPTYPEEWAERKLGDNEKPDESQILNERFARRRRFQSLQETFRKFIATGWEAEIVLGGEDANLVKPFEVLFTDLDDALYFVFEYVYDLSKPSKDLSGDEISRMHASQARFGS